MSCLGYDILSVVDRGRAKTKLLALSFLASLAISFPTHGSYVDCLQLNLKSPQKWHAGFEMSPSIAQNFRQVFQPLSFASANVEDTYRHLSRVKWGQCSVWSAVAYEGILLVLD